jgi:hypothetical protein
VDKQTNRRLSLHGLGVICGLTAAVWLGAAEAPTKLVTAGFSPFAISSAMVCGVFLSRWTFPTLLKGTAYVFADLADKKHLIVWALLAGVLWAEGNTLTVFAVRDVGLAVAFPCGMRTHSSAWSGAVSCSVNSKERIAATLRRLSSARWQLRSQRSCSDSALFAQAWGSMRCVAS